MQLLQLRHRLLVILILAVFSAQAQDDVGDLFRVDYDTPLTIDIDAEEDEDDVRDPLAGKKKKKKNKKVFFGIKTKRGFTKTGYGKKQVLELFHYLKVYEGPEEYTRDFYWFDTKKKTLVNSLKIRKNVALVLHGHYIKKRGDQVLEEGYFYKGMKHGRWMRYNTYDILQDKEIYWKGWPQESLISFYDGDKEKVREVIPVHFGEKEGTYYAFHPGGSVAVRGKYKFDYRIGLWREFYPNGATKREVKYPEDPFDFESTPIITKEWGEDGKIIYDREKFLSSLN
ncbi:MAG: hypothetical protein AAGA85_00460 [Bacteroidota bacterium]